MNDLQQDMVNLTKGIKPRYDEICVDKMIPFNVIMKMQVLFDAADDLLVEIKQSEYSDEEE